MTSKISVFVRDNLGGLRSMLLVHIRHQSGSSKSLLDHYGEQLYAEKVVQPARSISYFAVRINCKSSLVVPEEELSICAVRFSAVIRSVHLLANDSRRTGRLG